MNNTTVYPVRLAAGIVLSCLLGFGLPKGALAEVIPAPLETSESNLQPGLAVTYYWGFNNFIYNLRQRIDHSAGTPGEPLPNLDHRAGDGTVLTSGRHDGVGAVIEGFIQFEVPGDYQFAIESNDGVRFSLNGITLIEDPDVHPDRWSEVATATISDPGRYPIELLYFEKKNTSTLRLVWKTPSMTEDDDFVPVPDAAFTHRAE